MSKTTNQTIPLDEYADRRRKLSTALKNSVGVVFAGAGGGHLNDTYRPHPHFAYLTGVTSEPGTVLLLDPAHSVEARREILFLRPLNPELEKWDGLRMEISAALRESTGFKSIFRAEQFGRFLNESAKRAKSLACLHPLASVDQPVSPDLELFRKVCERMPGAEIVDMSDAVAELRSVKSAGEIAMIQKAIDITAAGFAEAMRAVKPGKMEFKVQATLEHAYREHGSRGAAFGTIVGSGINSTVLHYKANNNIIEDGDAIVIDSGASFGPDGAAYSADITRTVPANGKFTARQREVYDVVLKALEAATKAVKPGATLAEIDKTARAVIIKAGFGDHFIHSIGHHLGLETHDAAPAGGIGAPLREGNVLTIEPGIYIPQEKLGVRIEDDVVVTKDGCRVLSENIPRRAEDVEKAMG